jgi:glycosyltransferase involved in cell wall biosynthesis
LRSQLLSFEHQTSADWRVVASDDGSTDETDAILSQFRDKLGSSRMQIGNGPRQGFVANFLTLACNRSITGDYYAFSDQDDIWAPDKLSRALSWLEHIPADVPALWCGRTHLIDELDRSIAYSPLFRKRPSFKNALVQSIFDDGVDFLRAGWLR